MTCRPLNSALFTRFLLFLLLFFNPQLMWQKQTSMKLIAVTVHLGVSENVSLGNFSQNFMKNSVAYKNIFS